MLEGGPGRDLLSGGSVSDRLCGGAGDDELQGENRRDVVYGAAGNDAIFAWDGFADRLDGGPGLDYAWNDRLDRVSRIERLG